MILTRCMCCRLVRKLPAQSARRRSTRTRWCAGTAGSSRGRCGSAKCASNPRSWASTRIAAPSLAPARGHPQGVKLRTLRNSELGPRSTSSGGMLCAGPAQANRGAGALAPPPTTIPPARDCPSATSPRPYTRLTDITQAKTPSPWMRAPPRELTSHDAGARLLRSRAASCISPFMKTMGSGC